MSVSGGPEATVCGRADEVRGGADEPPERDHTLRTLRIALAVRGGISLAVWIGGAVAEIDVLRRTDHDGALAWPGPAPGPEGQRQRAAVYGDLLALAGYRRVEVDILAGASAGGLNSLLYGLAQSVGRTMDHVEDVWRDVAGMWSLMRPTLPIGRVPSLLQGDQYFYERVREEMYALARDGDVLLAHRASYLSVDLSATLLGGGDGVTEAALKQGRGQFRFVRRPAPLASGFTDLPGAADVPATGDPPTAVAFRLNRLALAARATSSFPGAFEPASVHSVAECGPVDGDGTDGISVPTMTGVFSGVRPRGTPLRGPDARPFHVIDGGVFDNVPIDRALRSINLAPAVGATERRLLYLEPDPTPPQVRSPKSSRSAPRWLSVIVRALAMKVSVETTHDELRLVREHNEQENAARGRQDALAFQLRGLASAESRVAAEGRAEPQATAPRGDGEPRSGAPRGDGDRKAGASRGDGDLKAAAPADIKGLDIDAYARCRATTDAPRLAALLTRPGEAGLGKPGLVGPYQVLDETRALALMTDLGRVYRTVAGDLAGDVQGVYDTAVLFIAWVRELEERNRYLRVNGSGPARDVIKNRLYRILRVSDFVRSLADAEFLSAFQGQGATTAGQVNLEAAVRRGLAFQHGLRPLTPAMKAHLTVADGGCLDDGVFYEDLATCYPQRGPAPLPRPDATDPSFLAGLWDCLDTARREILRWGEPIRGARYHLDLRDVPRPWESSVFDLLHRPPLSTRTSDGYRIPTRWVHSVFAAAGAAPGTASIIRYDYLTGSQPSPLAPLFTTLRAAEQRTRLGALLRRGPVDPDEPLLTARSKLAGVNLAHFGGFLSRNWRTNDWAWGRLDAAGTLVDLLVGDGRPDDAMPDAQWLCRFLKVWEAYVVTPVPGIDDRWPALLADGPLPPTPDTAGAVTPAHVACLRRGATAWLQYRLLTEARPGGGPAGSVADAAAGYFAGGQTVKDLRPAYRFGLASRAVHLGYRALWPALWTWKQVLIRIVMMTTRPLLTLVPLAVNPLRAAAVAVLLVLAVVAATPQPPDPSRRWQPVAACVAAGLMTLAGQIRAWYVWRGVRQTAARWGPDWRGAAEDRWGTARWCFLVGWTLGAALLVGGVWMSRVDTPLRHLGIGSSGPEVAAFSVLVLAAAFALFRLPYIVGGGGGSGWTWRFVGWALTGFGLAATLSPAIRGWFEPVPGWLGDDPRTPGAVGCVLLAAALSALVLWGWSHRVWAVVSIVGAGAAAGFCAWYWPVGWFGRYGPLAAVLVLWSVAMAVVTLVLAERGEMAD
ncbi:DUF3376 domain-containing protein [Longispora sp. NPDC051575]|uniref:DUF3376 domain-containing protein n=1 Tax=Longispora sp. NPDC051575 TaxID=3154943 RepID=UPI00342803DA